MGLWNTFGKTYDWLILIWMIISRVPPNPPPPPFLEYSHYFVLKHLFKLSPPEYDTLCIIDTFSDKTHRPSSYRSSVILSRAASLQDSPPPGSSCLGMFCAGCIWLAKYIRSLCHWWSEVCQPSCHAAVFCQPSCSRQDKEVLGCNAGMSRS